MTPSEKIDDLIAQNQDWRGDTLARLRKTILGVNPEIIEEWKWRGAPVWSLNGIICVGNIFKNQVKLVFMNGAALSDPDKLFNAGMKGNKWRAIDIFKNDQIDVDALKNLVGDAISYNQAKDKKKTIRWLKTK